MDEARVSTSIRSANWISSEYANQNSPATFYTAGDQESQDVVPTVTTEAVSSITDTTATGNGTVTDDGGDTITERGIVWSTSANPTTADDKATSAGTTGAFTASLTGLTSGTLYHARAYATNSVGTSYGDDVTFTTETDIPVQTRWRIHFQGCVKVPN
jgi:hypothetical protein